MPFYQTRGKIPRKRHIAFRPEGDDKKLYYEELIGNRGFKGASSLLYRLQRPTQLQEAKVAMDVPLKAAPGLPLRPHHFRLGSVPRRGNMVINRVPVLFNQDVTLSFSYPEIVQEAFYRNGAADELVYVADGEGTLKTAFGNLKYGQGDYLVIPRGIVHRFEFSGEKNRFLIVEGTAPIEIPSRYRNANGQLLEGAPYSERDIRTPQDLETHDETGEFEILTRRDAMLTRHVVKSHPFDLVGWDGTYYPWAFQIRDFEPIVGMIHQPPPVHQTFQSQGFVVCSFVPRLFDFHPEAIPAPYNHSNAQSEEIIFYASDEFMSRKGIDFASVTYHPDGMPHGPHPGTAEKSIGASRTDELAVMVDTFRPLHVAQNVLEFADLEYQRSWLESGEPEVGSTSDSEETAPPEE